MTMTQHEISMYLIEVEHFKRDFFNDSDLARLLKEHTGIKDSDLKWTEITQCLFDFIRKYHN